MKRMMELQPDSARSSGREHRIPGAPHPGSTGILARVERCEPSAVRGLEARALRRPRPGEAAGAKLTLVRNQELQCGAIGEMRRSLEGARASAVEALHRARDFVRRADWMRDRFPDARLPDVEELVRLFERGEVESHGWSLTPGRYVGVAHEEEDGDFDFEKASRAIHIDLKRLNEEAAELAVRIARNFEKLRA